MDLPDLPDLPGDPTDDDLTVPSGVTVEAERADATRGHGADHEPTEEEKAAAERGAATSPDVPDPYEEALHRGADIKGEGQISPD
jgi:hypothetical protein